MSRSISDGGGVHRSADWMYDFVWLVDQANRQVGPLSTMQLALAAKNGLLASDALIWREGLPRWFAADEIVGLLPAAQHRDTPQPPVPNYNPLPEIRSNTVDRLLAEHAPRHVTQPAMVSKSALASGRRTEQPARTLADWSSSAAAVTVPAVQAEEPFVRLRTMLRQRDIDGSGGAATPATGEILPALPPVKPLVASQGAASFSFTENLARNVAESIVHVLERHRIKSIDDLATGDRLRQLSVLVVDNLPGTVRLGLGTTIGRAVVEIKVVELFEFILFNIPRHHRQRDLRDVVEEYVPQLARALEEAVATAASKVGSFVMSNISQAVSAIRNELPATSPAPMSPTAGMSIQSSVPGRRLEHTAERRNEGAGLQAALIGLGAVAFVGAHGPA